MNWAKKQAQKKKPGVLLVQACFALGWLASSAFMSMAEDLCGKEQYLALVTKHWISAKYTLVPEILCSFWRSLVLVTLDTSYSDRVVSLWLEASEDRQSAQGSDRALA